MAEITTMVKKVNIIAKIPVRTLTPPVYGDVKGLMMTPANIMKCLIHRAIVDEVLADGTIVRLNMKNYNLDNSYLMESNKESNKPEKVSDVLQPAVSENDKGNSAVEIIKVNNTPEPVQNDSNLAAVETAAVEATVAPEPVEEEVPTTEEEEIAAVEEEEVTESEVESEETTPDGGGKPATSNNHSNRKKKNHH